MMVQEDRNISTDLELIYSEVILCRLVLRLLVYEHLSKMLMPMISPF